MKKSFKSTTKNTILSGRNIYKDKHGNTIYYHSRSNTAYRIKPEKENMFSTYQSRYVLALISFVFFYFLFNLNIYLSLGLALIIALFLEYSYRSFLKKCPQSKGFVKQEKIKPIDQMIDLSKGSLILRICLYLALAILLIVNSFVSSNVAGNRPIQVTSYIIAILAAFIAIKYLSLLSRKGADC